MIIEREDRKKYTYAELHDGQWFAWSKHPDQVRLKVNRDIYISFVGTSNWPNVMEAKYIRDAQHAKDTFMIKLKVTQPAKFVEID